MSFPFTLETNFYIKTILYRKWTKVIRILVTDMRIITKFSVFYLSFSLK